MSYFDLGSINGVIDAPVVGRRKKSPTRRKRKSKPVYFGVHLPVVSRRRQRKLELQTDSGIDARLAEHVAERERLAYVRRLLDKFGSYHAVVDAIELERIRPTNRLD